MLTKEVSSVDYKVQLKKEGKETISYQCVKNGLKEVIMIKQ